MPSVILLFGPPAAGKSSLARDVLGHYRAYAESTPLIYLSTDQLREAVSGPGYLGSIRPSIYQGIRSMTEQALASGHHVLIDGNYLDARNRTPLLQLFKRLKARALKVLVTCSLPGALRRNSGRVGPEKVPDDYLREVFGRVKRVRALADLCVDTEAGYPGACQHILSWLLEIPSEQLDLSRFPDPLEEEWLQRGLVLEVARGDDIWKAGSVSQRVVRVLEGELEVVRQVAGQPEVVINRLHAGELAGELSSLDGSPHSATVRATCPSRVVALDSVQFRSLMRRYPSLLDRVLQGMVSRIRSLSGAAGDACVDLLSGLGNRRMLEELLPEFEQRATRDGSPFSLAVFDIDRFKGINDTHGHEVGDFMIREVAQLLQVSIAPPGVCLRYGGDEFVVLLPGVNSCSAQGVLQGFVEQVRARSFEVSPQFYLKATISVGLASYPEGTSDCSQLFHLADQALYASKAAGRDRLSIWGAC